jgi:hypothetical protein
MTGLRARYTERAESVLLLEPDHNREDTAEEIGMLTVTAVAKE